MYVQHRKYLEFKNGKPFDAPVRQTLRDCIHESFDALGQMFSDSNSRGELGTNIVVREDKC